MLGDLYGETGQPEQALATISEAIRRLTPTFAAMPAAVHGIMAGLVQSYQAQCTAIGREPDADLLRPVLAGLAQSRPEEEP